MIKTLYKKLQHHFHHPNYLYFMMSLILLIIIPPLAATLTYGNIFLDVTFGVVILFSAYISATNIKGLLYFFLLGFLIYALFLWANRPPGINLLNTLLTLLFFLSVLRRLVLYILHSKRIDANDVFACISGYLVLGIIAAPLFSIIEQTFPGAFLLPEQANFYDFIYFSYMTLTTVGFGDITPLHPMAKSFTILLSLAGQLYLTILVAIIIGKYLISE